MNNTKSMVRWKKELENRDTLVYSHSKKDFFSKIEARRENNGWGVYRMVRIKDQTIVDSRRVSSLKKAKDVISILKAEEIPKEKLKKLINYKKTEGKFLRAYRYVRNAKFEKWNLHDFSKTEELGTVYLIQIAEDAFELDILLDSDLKFFEKDIKNEIIDIVGMNDIPKLKYTINYADFSKSKTKLQISEDAIIQKIDFIEDGLDE